MSPKNTPAPLNLDAIRRRAAAATPGPWVVGDRAGLHSHEVVISPTGRMVGLDWDATGTADAEFIAAARTDITALLAEVAALRARVAELEGADPERRQAAIENVLALIITKHQPDLAGHCGTGDGPAIRDDATDYTDAVLNALAGGA